MGNDKYLVIVNPNAGGGKVTKDWPSIEQLLKKANLDYEVFFTEYRHQAIKVVAEKIKQSHFRKIIVVGGDGTVNEVVNGIFKQDIVPTKEIILGVVMVGTGNDWGRMFDIPSDYAEAISLIKNGNSFIQDVGHVAYYLGAKQKTRYFINCAGLGFDALVTETTNKNKETGKSSTLSYFQSLLGSLFRYKPIPVKVHIDNREILNGNLFTLSLGIGKYTGGGMQQNPNAVADDGLFDLMLVDKIAKTKLIRKIKKLYDGSINDINEVQSYQVHNMRVESDHKLMLEVDGESLGHAPFTFGIIPESLQVIIH
ncbi:MAG: diacylglycerol kinase family lipid kinase [Bacteroidales bacterium]|nr:diacylglycerol kinase family lipid kinase [Bacteroidales bacterium]